MQFSVLIPVYNVEEYLRRCIDSVLHQSFHDYEMVIVDDGSFDQSPSICDEYARNYPNLIKVIHKSNQGLVSARRTALQHASGEFVCFLDSDDYWERTLLQDVHMEIHKHNCDMVIFGNFLVLGDAREKLPKLPNFSRALFVGSDISELKYLLVGGTQLNQLWKKVVRLSVIDKDKDYSEFFHVSSGEDQLQTLPMLDQAAKIVILNKCLYNYCVNQDSITQSKVQIRQIESLLTVYNELGVYAKKWEIPMALYHQRLGNIIVIIFKSLFIHRFGRDSYTIEQRHGLIERLKESDFQRYLDGFSCTELDLVYRICTRALKTHSYWSLGPFITLVGFVYHTKKKYHVVK